MKKIFFSALLIILFLLSGCNNSTSLSSDISSSTVITSNVNTSSLIPDANTFIGDYKKAVETMLGYKIPTGETTATQNTIIYTHMNESVSVFLSVEDGKVPVACATVLPIKMLSFTEDERLDAITAMHSIASVYNRKIKTPKDFLPIVDSMEIVGTENGIKKSKCVIDGIEYSLQEGSSLLTFQVSIPEYFENKNITNYDLVLPGHDTLVSGQVLSTDRSFGRWSLVLETAIDIEDPISAITTDILYFYDDDVLDNKNISAYENKTITIECGFENYRGGGEIFITNPSLIEITGDSSLNIENDSAITKKTFESTVDINDELAKNEYLFEMFFEEKLSNSIDTWEYIGTTYNTFSLPEYDFYSFEIYKAGDEYYLFPFNEYTSAPTLYRFIENTSLELVWTPEF